MKAFLTFLAVLFFPVVAWAILLLKDGDWLSIPFGLLAFGIYWLVNKLSDIFL